MSCDWRSGGAIAFTSLSITSRTCQWTRPTSFLNCLFLIKGRYTLSVYTARRHVFMGAGSHYPWTRAVLAKSIHRRRLWRRWTWSVWTGTRRPTGVQNDTHDEGLWTSCVLTLSLKAWLTSVPPTQLVEY